MLALHLVMKAKVLCSINSDEFAQRMRSVLRHIFLLNGEVANTEQGDDKLGNIRWRAFGMDGTITFVENMISDEESHLCSSSTFSSGMYKTNCA